jgi:hypothetical protein
MLEMGLRQPNVARAAQTTAADRLFMGRFNPRTGGILLLELRSGLAFARGL